mmetsp:Transcript_17218/g.41831  ORF Transcript_17218/g.41831 Transcript_17218/m.41831 type:complete len:643 (+) Transcript_17218:440-2368(+)
MGLHRPFKPPKSTTTAVDPAPPVFSKHEDLHKGHKPDQDPNRHHQQKQQINGHKPSSSRSHGQSSSTSRDVKTSQRSATSNKSSSSKSKSQNTKSSSQSLGRKPSRSGSGTSTSSTDLWIAAANASADEEKRNALLSSEQSSEHSTPSVESYYDEEIVEENVDFNEISGQEQELNLFPDRTPTIRFDEYDEMQTVLHINDYTKHEINRSWYKRPDYDKMVQLARKTAEKAEQRKKELQLEEQEERRRQLDEDTENDAQQRSSSSQKNRRSSRGGSSRGARTGDDDDEKSGESREDERSSSKHSRKTGRGESNGSSNKRTSKDDSTKSNDGKTKEKKKPIEYRGLEAWTASGASKVKLLKESSIELVWNEQSKQWDNGTFNPDTIRAVYVPVSETALQAAYERGKNDALIVQKLLEMDRLAAEKKKRRKFLGKSKALVKKSVKLTGKSVQQTGKLMKKTTKVTTKVAKEATKRSLKAGIATATLDPRMMKEAMKVSKRRECKHEVIRTPSRANTDGSIDGSQHSEGEVYTPSVEFEDSDRSGKQTAAGNGNPSSDPTAVEHAESSMTDSTPPPGVPRDSLEKAHKEEHKTKTKHKLKLLGVVPIPGTKKTWYKEDRREKRAEKRIQKQKRRPSWEVGTADGKY